MPTHAVPPAHAVLSAHAVPSAHAAHAALKWHSLLQVTYPNTIEYDENTSDEYVVCVIGTACDTGADMQLWV